MKPLIWKELRENLRWLPVGLLVVAAICWYSHPMQPANISYSPLSQTLATHLGIALPLFAFALGIIQSYRDLQPGPRAYLGHRKVSQSQILTAKLLVGLLLYSLSVLPPIAILAAWIAYHGMEWYPMRPAQVVPALAMALGAFLWHPSAMLLMVRNASWWGTKWFPLVPAAATCLILMSSLPNQGLSSASISVVFLVPLSAWLILIVRDSWQVLPADPSSAQTNRPLRRRALLPAFLVIISLVMVTAVIGVSIALREELKTSKTQWTSGSYKSPHLAVEKSTNKPWLLTNQYTYNSAGGSYTPTLVEGDLIEPNKTLQLHDLDRPIENFRLSQNTYPFISFRIASDGFFSIPTSWRANMAWTYCYDEQGYVLFYFNTPEFRWTNTLSASGMHARGEALGKPFAFDPIAVGASVFAELQNHTLMTPLVDHSGIYSLNSETLNLIKLVDHPVDACTMLSLEEDRPASFVVRSGRKILLYQFPNIVPKREQSDNSSIDPIEPLRINVDRNLNSLLTVQQVATYTLPESATVDRWTYIVQTNDKKLITSPIYESGSVQLFVLSPDGTSETIAFKRETSDSTGTSPGPDEIGAIAACSLPGLVLLAPLVTATWNEIAGDPTQGWQSLSDDRRTSLILFVSWPLWTLLALGLTLAATKHRRLTKGQRVSWTLATLLLGFAAPIAVLAIYQRVVLEPCSNCGEMRRVDLQSCEACAAAWQPTEASGIEILDDAPRYAASSIVNA
jgi:hypothetical protein